MASIAINITLGKMVKCIELEEKNRQKDNEWRYDCKKGKTKCEI